MAAAVEMTKYQIPRNKPLRNEDVPRRVDSFLEPFLQAEFSGISGHVANG